MTPVTPRRLRAGRLPAALMLAVLLGGCFENREEAAISAWRDGDYARAAALADALAAENHPRGWEILALLSAQGIGGDIDFVAAMAHVDRAEALDPAYAASRRAILDRIATTEADAERAFEGGDHARAHRLAVALADYGSETGETLLDRLYGGHYVRLPDSDLTWREFWQRCSGSIRDEDEAAGTARFENECRGRRVTWEGTIVRVRDGEVTVKMAPGRGRAPEDLVLAMARSPGDPIRDFGRKVRFSGVVAARGGAARPDRLADGTILGPAWATAADRATLRAAGIAKVRTACTDLFTHLYRTTHAPDWVEASRRRAEENGWPAQPMAFSIRFTTPDSAFAEQDDGSWRADVEGIATIILARVKPGRMTEIAFSGECRVTRLDTRDPEEMGSAEIAEERVRIDIET